MAGESSEELKMNDVVEKESEKDDNESTEQNGSTTDKLVKLPISRIRKIIKTDPDVSLTSQEAMIVITKATELFVQHLSREAVVYTFQGKRKTIQRKDLDCAVDRTDSLAFLDAPYIKWFHALSEAISIKKFFEYILSEKGALE